MKKYTKYFILSVLTIFAFSACTTPTQSIDPTENPTASPAPTETPAPADSVISVVDAQKIKRDMLRTEVEELIGVGVEVERYSFNRYTEYDIEDGRIMHLLYYKNEESADYIAGIYFTLGPISAENAEKIKENMTQDEVIALIGEGLSVGSGMVWDVYDIEDGRTLRIMFSQDHTDNTIYVHEVMIRPKNDA